VDLDRDPVERIVARVSAQPGPVIHEVIAGVDEWALERRRTDAPAGQWRRLLAVADAIDRDERRRKVRRLLAKSPARRTPAGAGRWDGARAELRRLAQEVDPTKTPPLQVLTLARALSAFGEGAAGEALLNAVVAVRRGEAVLLYALALMLEQYPSRRNEAVEYYRAVCAARPQLGLSLGLALLRAGRAVEGEAVLRALARQQPENSYTMLHLELARGKGLIDTLRKLTALHPDDAEGHYNLGCALAERKQGREAIAAFRKAIALRPDYAEAHYNLGNGVRDLGDLAGAVSEYDRAIASKPDYAVAHYNRGLVLYQMKKPAEAEAAFRNAIKHREDYSEAHNNLGNLLSQRGQLGEAATHFGAAAALDPGNGAAHFNLGNTLQQTGQFKEAAEAYRGAIRADANDAEAHNNLGVVLRKLKKLPEALAAFRAADRLLRDHPVIREHIRVTALWMELEKKSADILAGKAKLKTGREQLDFARFCGEYREDHRAAAQFYAAAFEADARLANHEHRFPAACHAVLASGKEPDVKERSRLRLQALRWLRAELDDWSREVKNGPARVRRAARAFLANVKSTPALADARDKEALEKMPEGDRRPLVEFWAEVERLLANLDTGN
jgi:tetratricopeptide (TPR) repeat protein